MKSICSARVIQKESHFKKFYYITVWRAKLKMDEKALHCILRSSFSSVRGFTSIIGLWFFSSLFIQAACMKCVACDRCRWHGISTVPKGDLGLSTTDNTFNSSWPLLRSQFLCVFALLCIQGKWSPASKGMWSEWFGAFTVGLCREYSGGFTLHGAARLLFFASRCL